MNPLPAARTIGEAYMYLELTLPAGESWVDYDRYTSLHSVDDQYVLRFDGPYEGRQISHEVTIPHASHRAADEAGQQYGLGCSTLIDAGQWYVIEAAYAGMAQTGLDQLAGSTPDEQTYRAIVEAWESAAAAAGQLEKFLPPDTEDVPAEAFWTEHGRRVRGQRRDAFRRSRLAGARAFYQRRSAEIRSGQPTLDESVVDARAGRVPSPRAPAEPERVHPWPRRAGPLLARTYGEAHVFMDLHPCDCGSALFPRGRMEVLDDDERGAIVRYAGPCDECAQPREFTFWLPARPGLPPESPYLFSWPSDPPSRLLDPGDWAAVSEGYAALTDLLGGFDTPTADGTGPTDSEDVVKLLTSAAAALDEVLRFFPPDVDVLPPEAFWTGTGQDFRDLEPDRFRRSRVEELRALRWRRVADFTAGYGR